MPLACRKYSETQSNSHQNFFQNKRQNTILFVDFIYAPALHSLKPPLKRHKRGTKESITNLKNSGRGVSYLQYGVIVLEECCLEQSAEGSNRKRKDIWNSVISRCANKEVFTTSHFLLSRWKWLASASQHYIVAKKKIKPQLISGVNEENPL